MGGHPPLLLEGLTSRKEGPPATPRQRYLRYMGLPRRCTQVASGARLGGTKRRIAQLKQRRARAEEVVSARSTQRRLARSRRQAPRALAFSSETGILYGLFGMLLAVHLLARVLVYQLLRTGLRSVTHLLVHRLVGPTVLEWASSLLACLLVLIVTTATSGVGTFLFRAAQLITIIAMSAAAPGLRIIAASVGCMITLGCVATLRRAFVGNHTAHEHGACQTRARSSPPASAPASLLMRAALIAIIVITSTSAANLRYHPFVAASTAPAAEGFYPAIVAAAAGSIAALVGVTMIRGAVSDTALSRPAQPPLSGVLRPPTLLNSTADDLFSGGNMARPLTTGTSSSPPPFSAAASAVEGNRGDSGSTSATTTAAIPASAAAAAAEATALACATPDFGLFRCNGAFANWSEREDSGPVDPEASSSSSSSSSDDSRFREDSSLGASSTAPLSSGATRGRAFDGEGVERSVRPCASSAAGAPVYHGAGRGAGAAAAADDNCDDAEMGQAEGAAPSADASSYPVSSPSSGSAAQTLTGTCRCGMTGLKFTKQGRALWAHKRPGTNFKCADNAPFGPRQAAAAQAANGLLAAVLGGLRAPPPKPAPLPPRAGSGAAEAAKYAAAVTLAEALDFFGEVPSKRHNFVDLAFFQASGRALFKHLANAVADGKWMQVSSITSGPIANILGYRSHHGSAKLGSIVTGDGMEAAGASMIRIKVVHDRARDARQHGASQVSQSVKAVLLAARGRSADALESLDQKPSVEFTPPIQAVVAPTYPLARVIDACKLGCAPTTTRPKRNASETVDAKCNLYATLQGHRDSTAPDADGGCMQALYRIFQCDGDATRDCIAPLLLIVDAITGGFFEHPSLINSMSASAAFPIAKKGHTAAIPSIRTIAVPMTVVRLAASFDFSVWKEEQPEACKAAIGRWQFGLETAGCEAFARSIMAKATTFLAPQPDAAEAEAEGLRYAAGDFRGILSIDIMGAFPTVGRGPLVGAAALIGGGRFNWAINLGFIFPSLVHYTTPAGERVTYRAEQGAAAGHPLTPLFYMAVLEREVLAPLRTESAALGRPADFSFYLDDGADAIWASDVPVIMGLLVKYLGAIGQVLCVPKVEFLPLGRRNASPASDALLKSVRELGIACPTDGIICAGFPIGSAAFCTAYAEKVASSTISALKRVEMAADLDGAAHCFALLPRVQALFLVIRLCIAAKFMHILRALPPAYTMAAARRVDVATLQVCLDMTELDWKSPVLAVPDEPEQVVPSSSAVCRAGDALSASPLGGGGGASDVALPPSPSLPAVAHAGSGASPPGSMPSRGMSRTLECAEHASPPASASTSRNGSYVGSTAESSAAPAHRHSGYGARGQGAALRGTVHGTSALPGLLDYEDSPAPLHRTTWDPPANVAVWEAAAVAARARSLRLFTAPSCYGGLGFISLETAAAPAYVASCLASLTALIRRGLCKSDVTDQAVFDTFYGLKMAACLIQDAVAHPLSPLTAASSASAGSASIAAAGVFVAGGAAPHLVLADLQARESAAPLPMPRLHLLTGANFAGSAATADTAPLAKTQHKLYDAMWSAVNARFLLEAGPAEQARMRSASGKGAAHFMLATPACAALALTDRAFASAVACRLGLSAVFIPRHVGPALQHGPPHTSASAGAAGGLSSPPPLWRLWVCRKCGASMEQNAHHAFVCPKRTTNQEMAELSACGLRNALAAAPGRPFNVLAQYGGNPLQVDITKYADVLKLLPFSPMELAAKLHKDATLRPRGDMMIIHMNLRYIVLDFVVTFPAQASILAFTRVTDAFAATEMELKKVAHYNKYYKNLGTHPDAIIPCATEIFGTLGQRYHDLIAAIGNMAFPQVLVSKVDTDGMRSRFIDRVRQHVSVTQARIIHAVFESWRADMCPPN